MTGLAWTLWKREGNSPRESVPRGSSAAPVEFSHHSLAKLLFPPTILKSTGAISKSLMCSGFYVKGRNQSHLFRVSKLNALGVRFSEPWKCLTFMFLAM